MNIVLFMSKIKKKNKMIRPKLHEIIQSNQKIFFVALFMIASVYQIYMTNKSLFAAIRIIDRPFTVIRRL